MAIYTERLEAGVYLGEWHGAVSIEQIAEAMETFREYADVYGDPAYVMLVDMTDGARVPLDIQYFNQLLQMDKRLRGAVTIQAPHVSKMLSSVMSRLTRLSFGFAETRDEAITQARSLLSDTASAS